ncbi:MAG: DNA integrity scanning protein DisA nucleotide-binding domain protein [Nanoarchaeota archaeon]|nr:DNA integrity scanning protein DisA nucleotide-binding domain protein [Nanoarchaeota archaeon]
MKNKIKNKVEQVLIDTAMKIAKQEKGCLFIIKEGKLNYETLIEQDVKPFSIYENPRRLEALALLDGACVISEEGKLLAYSAKIKKTKVYSGYGTRHSAAYSASLSGNTAILASEEDRKIRIFKGGVLIMQIDPLEKNIEYKTKEAVNILESVGVGSVASFTASTLLPAAYTSLMGVSSATPAGFVLVPGIIVFGAAHYLVKQIKSKKN